ncbi:MAG: hypothetical protein N2445_03400 [Acidobacteria bacterium]|nr:hypothetical protein [Acidobacteriota bacterium]
MIKGDGDNYWLLANIKKSLTIGLKAGEKRSDGLQLKIKPMNGRKICDFEKND